MMDAWQRLLDGEREDIRLALQETFGEDIEMNVQDLIGSECDIADDQAAICCECGATCPLDEVYNGYEQSATAPCGHSWYSYRHDGQYILE